MHIMFGQNCDGDYCVRFDDSELGRAADICYDKGFHVLDSNTSRMPVTSSWPDAWKACYKVFGEWKAREQARIDALPNLVKQQEHKDLDLVNSVSVKLK